MEAKELNLDELDCITGGYDNGLAQYAISLYGQQVVIETGGSTSISISQIDVARAIADQYGVNVDSNSVFLDPKVITSQGQHMINVILGTSLARMVLVVK